MKIAWLFPCLILECWAGVSLAGPSVSCDQPRYDFGAQHETQLITHDFEIKNVGDEPLKISRIRPSCYCTRATMDKTELNPGETGSVNAEMSLRGRSGHQSKNIRVESNDPKNPNLMLYLDGSVISDYELTPRHLYFGGALPDSVMTGCVEIAMNRSLAVTGLVSTLEMIAADVTELAAGKAYQITAVTCPPLQEGGHKGQVVVLCEGREQISIPVTLMVSGPLSVAPKELNLTEGEDRFVTRYIIVREGQVKEFGITGVDVPDERITHTVFPMGTSGYRVQLNNVPAIRALDGKGVVIHTDADEMPTVEVPFKVSDSGAK